MIPFTFLSAESPKIINYRIIKKTSPSCGEVFFINNQIFNFLKNIESNTYNDPFVSGSDDAP